jgi:hypothetical protein
MRPGSQLALAVRLQAGTLTLGEAFAFMSGLYFRGKLAYATRFGCVDDEHPATPRALTTAPRRRARTSGLVKEIEIRQRPQPVYVITPTRGLLPPDVPVSVRLLQEFAGVDVHADDARYRRPLDESSQRLRELLPADARLVLLGSIATGKYVDVLTRIFADRLYFPSDFVGRGDMSRGGLMLRSAAAGAELEYTSLNASVVRRGTRPPKLPPLGRPSWTDGRRSTL